MTNEDLKRFYQDNEKITEPGDFVRFDTKGRIAGGCKKIEVSGITTMTNDQINSIDCGDIVVKNENGNKHAYTVSYKEDKVGICLTYSDATINEPVSYDYTDGNWVYNSTDVGHLS